MRQGTLPKPPRPTRHPFISGKDSFHNYFKTDSGPVSIPVTALVSGLGIIEDKSHVTGSSLRHEDSSVVLLGKPDDGAAGGSVWARRAGFNGGTIPDTDLETNLDVYRAYHRAVDAGLILSCHDVSEGGLAVALAEIAFSMRAGLDIETNESLFTEAPGRLIAEVEPGVVEHVRSFFPIDTFRILGRATPSHRRLRIRRDRHAVIDEDLAELKSLWKQPLRQYY